MHNISKTALILVVCSIICASAPAVRSATFAQGLSDATGPIVAAGIVATAFGSSESAKANAARVADAAIIALGTAELLKPNVSIGDAGHSHSFPSGHTALAFATATSLADLKPKCKWLYYAGAALIGWSRVETDAHTWGDVVGGAALGFAAGRWSMGSSDGLLLGRVYRF